MMLDLADRVVELRDGAWIWEPSVRLRSMKLRIPSIPN